MCVLFSYFSEHEKLVHDKIKWRHFSFLNMVVPTLKRGWGGIKIRVLSECFGRW
jgi:hypothetical protein